MKLLGTISVDFDLTDELLIRFFAFVRYWKKKWEYSETVHQLFIGFKKAYDSVRREVLYNILIEFGIPMKLVRPIKMCLNETFCDVFDRRPSLLCNTLIVNISMDKLGAIWVL
jgi:hypothetical protein